VNDEPTHGPDVDETLGEGPLERAELQELVRQRMAHALLRANSGADAESREARIQSVLAALPRARMLSFKRVTAAAAIVLAGGLAVRMMVGRESRLAAAISGARQCLEMPVDREFGLTVWESELDDPYEQVGTHVLTTRPKGFFLLEGNGRYGKFRIGRPGLDKDTWAVLTEGADSRLDEKKLIAAIMSLEGGTIDVGFLDLQRVLDTLPRADALAFAGAGVEGERHIERYEGTWSPTLVFGGLEHAAVAFDQETREVVRLELDMRNPLGAKRKRLRFDYRKTTHEDPSRYERP
jgi:hypothetical protein